MVKQSSNESPDTLFNSALGKLMQQYLVYAELQKGRSLNTIKNYRRYLRRFLEYSQVTTVAGITDEEIMAYQLKLNRTETQKGTTLSKRTQNYHLIALRNFLKYLVRQKIVALPPERIELAKTSDRELDLISTDDLEPPQVLDEILKILEVSSAEH